MTKQTMSDKFTLTDHFLIAMPALNDPHFQQTVSYICEHNSEGAMGIVINRPSELTLADLCEQLNIPLASDEIATCPVFYGGPVETERGFILHTPVGNWDSTLTITKDIGLTVSQDIIRAIAEDYDPDNKRPEHFIISLGYAGWSADQIEDEIAENAWLNVAATKDILFSSPVEQRWAAAAALLGINIQQLSSDIGHA